MRNKIGQNKFKMEGSRQTIRPLQRSLQKYQKPSSNTFVVTWQKILKISTDCTYAAKNVSKLGKSRQRVPEQHPVKVHVVTAARVMSDDCSIRGLGRLCGGEGDGGRRQNLRTSHYSARSPEGHGRVNHGHARGHGSRPMAAGSSGHGSERARVTAGMQNMRRRHYFSASAPRCN